MKRTFRRVLRDRRDLPSVANEFEARTCLQPIENSVSKVGVEAQDASSTFVASSMYLQLMFNSCSGATLTDKRLAWGTCIDIYSVFESYQFYVPLSSASGLSHPKPLVELDRSRRKEIGAILSNVKT